MNPRSHSLNHVVWVTMTAIDVTPTSRVQRKATTWSDRLTMFCSEGLADAEVNAPLPLLRLAIHLETVDRIELIAEIDARRADRCLIPQTRTDGVVEVIQVERPALRRH